MTKPPAERQKWLLDWFRGESFAVADILNSEFVDAYIEATGASFRRCNWGAHKCRALSDDLRALWKKGYLSRARVSLSGGSWEPGLPTWVWSYYLSNQTRRRPDHVEVGRHRSRLRNDIGGGRG